MKRIDFARATIAWTTRQGSRGLWRIAAAARSDGGEAWYLADAVMAGDVYGQESLPLQPAYSFQFAASRDRHVMFRDAVDAGGPQDSAAPHAESFEVVTIDAPEIDAIAVPFDGLVDQTPWPLTARLVATGPRGRRWTLEFPVNHLNVRVATRTWQVETGPVLVPHDLFEIAGAAATGGLQRAFVFFNRADRVDLLGFGPTGSGRRGFAHTARLEAAEITLFA
jgi:hypothetical protein